MGQGSGIREVAWVDIAGGGQVVLDGNYAYVGHMQPPHGTSVLDVSDPAHPKVVASIDIPSGLHSHKVRVANDIMVTVSGNSASSGVRLKWTFFTST